MRKLLRRFGRSAPPDEGPADDEPGAYDRRDVADAEAIARLETGLAAAGVRLLPYPFRHILSIVSDCDFSHAADSTSVLRELCFERNLDFGDSFHLFDPSERPGSSNVAHLSKAPAPAECFAKSREDFIQLSRLGFFDHFHGIAGRRPEGLWLGADAFEATPRGHRSKPLADLARDLATEAGGIAVRHLELRLSETPSTPVHCTLRLETGAKLELERGPSEGARLRFRVPERPFAPWPRVATIASVEVGGGGGRVEGCTLFPLAREDVDAACQALEEAGLRFPLLTDHASTGFLNQSADARHRRAETERAAKGGPAEIVFFDRSAERPSLLPDAPGSALYCCDLLAGQGLRFINPSGTSGQPLDALHPLEVLARGRRRDEAPVYVARRILPAIARGRLDRGLSKKLQAKSRLSTFSARLRTALDQTTPTSGPLAFPLYTHLGANQEWEDRAERFEPEEIRALQDRVFGFGGDVGDDARTYVVRASAFYTYLQMLGQIAERVERDGDTVRLRSGPDPWLDERFPRSAGELHGLTLSVPDARRARVELDGTPLPDLLRIGRHTGAPEEWVTVLSGGIRQVATLGPAERVRVTNLLGNFYYVGIECPAHAGADLAFTIRGSGGLELYVGPGAHQPEGSVGGRILVGADAADSHDRVTWVSLPLADWAVPPDSPVAGFGTDLDIHVHVHARPDAAAGPVRLHLMKPAVRETRGPGRRDRARHDRRVPARGRDSGRLAADLTHPESALHPPTPQPGEPGHDILPEPFPSDRSVSSLRECGHRGRPGAPGRDSRPDLGCARRSDGRTRHDVRPPHSATPPSTTPRTTSDSTCDWRRSASKGSASTR